MTRTTTRAIAATLTLGLAALALPASAQDVMRTASVDIQDSAVQATAQRCASPDSSAQAIVACTKLLRLSVDDASKVKLLEYRAAHREALGKTEAAQQDRRQLAALRSKDDTRRYALNDR